MHKILKENQRTPVQNRRYGNPSSNVCQQVTKGFSSARDEIVALGAHAQRAESGQK